MIDGALRRMSLTKRTTSPVQCPRAYSARNVPARMPVGVPIAVAIPTISRLPTIAFSSPPLLPGGGVICVKIAGPIAPMPPISSEPSTSTSSASPTAVATNDSPMMMRLARTRL